MYRCECFFCLCGLLQQRFDPWVPGSTPSSLAQNGPENVQGKVSGGSKVQSKVRKVHKQPKARKVPQSKVQKVSKKTKVGKVHMQAKAGQVSGKAAIYARVSTKTNEKKSGGARQVAACEQKAFLGGWCEDCPQDVGSHQRLTVSAAAGAVQ